MRPPNFDDDLASGREADPSPMAAALAHIDSLKAEVAGMSPAALAEEARRRRTLRAVAGQMGEAALRRLARAMAAAARNARAVGLRMARAARAPRRRRAAPKAKQATADPEGPGSPARPENHHTAINQSGPETPDQLAARSRVDGPRMPGFQHIGDVVARVVARMATCVERRS